MQLKEKVICFIAIVIVIVGICIIGLACSYSEPMNGPYFGGIITGLVLIISGSLKVGILINDDGQCCTQPREENIV